MITEVTLYTVKCDLCWTDAFEDWDYWAFFEKDVAEYQAVDEHWFIQKNEKHYCSDCWNEDEDGNILIKDKFRIVYNFWDRKGMDYAPKHFKTQDEAKKYIIWFEWDFVAKDEKFLIESYF